jgi:hypothetical protein
VENRILASPACKLDGGHGHAEEVVEFVSGRSTPPMLGSAGTRHREKPASGLRRRPDGAHQVFGQAPGMSRELHHGTLGTATSLVATVSFAGALSVALRGELAPAALLAALAALLTVPFVVIGLCMVQRPGIWTLGQAGAIVLAGSCLPGAFVVLYALVAGTHDAAGLHADLGSSVWAAEAALVPGGLAFGTASYVRGLLPRWACASFVLGLLLVIPTLGAPAGFQLVVLGLADLGLLGMGLALIPTPPLPRRIRQRVAPAAEGRRDSPRRSGTRPLAPGI